MNWEIVNTVVSRIQIVVSIVLVLSVLMQSAKKEGMAGIVGGASETFFGKNKGRTLDAKFAVVTTASAIIFLISSLVLSYGMMRANKVEAPETTTQQYTDITTEDVAEPEVVEGEEAAEEAPEAVQE